MRHMKSKFHDRSKSVMQSGAGGVASQYTRQQTDNFTTSASQVNLLNEVNDETDAGTFIG